LMVRDMLISFIVDWLFDRGNSSRNAESPWTTQLGGVPGSLNGRLNSPRDKEIARAALLAQTP
jgi:hypothetical protein